MTAIAIQPKRPVVAPVRAAALAGTSTESIAIYVRLTRRSAESILLMAGVHLGLLEVREKQPKRGAA